MAADALGSIKLNLDRMAGYLAAGNLEAAIRVNAELLAVAPQNAGVQHNAALLAHKRGDTAAAVAHMREACQLAPADPQLHKQFGSLLVNVQRSEEALQHFDISLRLAPEDGHTWYLTGLALLRQGQATQALAALQKAEPYRPDDLRLKEALAYAAFDGGLPEEALPIWRAFAATRPDDLNIQLKWGEVLSRNGLHDAALAHFLTLSSSPSHAADACMAIAQTYEDLGNRSQAADAYRAACAARPGWGFPLAGLLQLRPEAVTEADAAQANDMLSHERTTQAERALLAYALGKVHDRRGEHEHAFEYWTLANRTRRSMAGEPDIQGLVGRTDTLMRRFQTTPSAELGLSARVSPPALPDKQMILIVGMPRSGTTLTEQIIASHPLAHGCGELAELPLLAQALWPRMGQRMPAWIDGLDQATLASAADAYARAASRGANPAAKVLVDKAPLNFFNLWLAALLNPDIKVVWCRRDPRDIAVSIYGENFALGERLCTRLDGIGHYIRAHDRLMRHWQNALQMPILEVSYESLVSEPKTQAKRLIAFTGLEWDPGCLQFHERETAVQTPSRWQVRQPVHTRSVGRWRHYERHLRPLLEALNGES